MNIALLIDCENAKAVTIDSILSELAQKGTTNIRRAYGDWIIKEVRENWHPRKERFTPAILSKWLHWMRECHLIPLGIGPYTIHQISFQLRGQLTQG